VPSYDVIVVGARCAGAAVAKRLADAGKNVVLLDAAKLPCDQTTSTHLIQPPGMDELERLGVASAVRALSPAIHTASLTYDGHEARLPYGDGRAAHCLRRKTLDGLLQHAAVASGADLRDRCKVVELLRDRSGSVNGVVVQRDGAQRERINAHLVVGADGRNSTVAKLTAAEEYFGYIGPRSVYWAYWQRPAGWSPHELHNIFDGYDAHVIFPTDGDQLLIAAVPPVEVAEQWRHRHVDAYVADVISLKRVGSYLETAKPFGGVRGVLKPRYFFRAAVGPGWALIGDARHHKEFVIGLGISDALRDARGLSEAITDGEREAINRWWRRRDTEEIEMFYWSRDLGLARPVNALQRLVAARLAVSPGLAMRFGEVIEGRVRPYDFVPTNVAVRWVLGNLLRGDGQAVAPLLEVARRRLSARRQHHLLDRIAKH
jgi:menaquinone-9 beta-reductase